MERKNGVRSGDAAPQIGGESAGVFRGMTHMAALAQASELARSGHYAAAENLLSEMMRDGDESPAFLDLIARIRAQQGRYDEAEVFWTHASRVDPTNPAYADGLRRIASLRRKAVRYWSGRLFLAMAVLVVMLLSMMAAQKLFTGYSREWSRKLRAMEDKQVEVVGSLGAIHRQIGEIGAQNKTLADSIQRLDDVVSRQGNAWRETTSGIGERPSAAPPAGSKPETAASTLPDADFELSSPGTTTERESDGLVVRFAQGIFLNGAALREGAQEVLQALADQLRAHADKVDICIEGHTDDLPVSEGGPYRNNPELGLQRAFAVMRFLSEECELPRGLFTLRTLGEDSPSYSNDSDENRMRNRTVVLRIRMK